jgi:hypothetical protein
MRRIASVWLFLFAVPVGLVYFNPWPFSAPVLQEPSALAAQESNSGRLRELNTIIQEEIGTPSAKDPAQCKSIAFGAKPCGGPTRYLVYSTDKTDEARLKQLVNESNELTKKINQEKKLISDCMVVSEPKVELVGGMCTVTGK